MTTQPEFSLQHTKPWRRAGFSARPCSRAGSTTFVAIASLAASLVVACSDFADDCNYNLTCGNSVTGGLDAGDPSSITN